MFLVLFQDGTDKMCESPEDVPDDETVSLVLPVGDRERRVFDIAHGEEQEGLHVSLLCLIIEAFNLGVTLGRVEGREEAEGVRSIMGHGVKIDPLRGPGSKPSLFFELLRKAQTAE